MVEAVSYLLHSGSAGGVAVSTYMHGADTRVRITDLADDSLLHLTLSMEQWAELHDAVIRLGPACEGEEL